MQALPVLQPLCCGPETPPLPEEARYELAACFKALADPTRVAIVNRLAADPEPRGPRKLDRDGVEWADLVVTMGCGDACPVLPGKRYVDWNLPDPAGADLETTREIRDEIARRVAELPR